MERARVATPVAWEAAGRTIFQPRVGKDNGLRERRREALATALAHSDWRCRMQGSDSSKWS